MDDADSLRTAFDGVHAVYSVQNPVISGVEREVLQGTNVGQAAEATGVAHLVYASAGVGRPTGVPSWDSKLEVEGRLQRLNLPVTVLRPMAFMELMTTRKFYPAMSTWHVMPTLMGKSRPVAWLAVDDLGTIAAKVFAEPDRFAGRTLGLCADLVSLEECRELFREVVGHGPRRFPLPASLFARMGFVGRDLTAMWRWLRTNEFEADVDGTRAVHPEALDVRAWLTGWASPARPSS
jgi:uncharacterized protein YbjT (DUF2867 family)